MKKKIILFGILFIFILKFLFFNQFIYNDHETNTKNINYDVNTINEINIELSNADVQINYGDVSDINVILTQNIIEKETKEFSAFQNGNVLTIGEYKKKQEIFPFYQFGIVQIIIPKNFVLANCKIIGEGINLVCLKLMPSPWLLSCRSRASL